MKQLMSLIFIVYLEYANKNKKYVIKNKSNSNYYPSVASVDSSSIKSTYIFPETLNKNA